MAALLSMARLGPRSGAGRLLLLSTALLAMTSCSARKVAYNLAEPLLFRMIDSAAKLRPEQEKLLRPRLHALLQWHRSSELSRYAALIDELRLRLRDGLSKEDEQWGREATEALWRRLAERLSPDAAALLSTLSAEQVNRLERDGQKRSQKRYAPYDLAGQDYAQRRTDELSRTLTGYLGPLSKGQRALLWDHFVRNQKDAQLRRDATLRQEKELYDLLRRRLPEAELSAVLLSRMVREESTLTAEERAAQGRLEAQFAELALRVLAEASAAQRQRLDGELQKLRDELSELSQNR